MTLDIRIVSLSPMLSVEFTLRRLFFILVKSEDIKNNLFMSGGKIGIIF